jgi:RNA polymerase sigma factor (sigma-70 family)
MRGAIMQESVWADEDVEDDVCAIWAAAKAGRPGGWQALTARYSGLVYSVIRSFGLQSADVADVYQNTWLRLFENADSIREPRGLGGWLVTTARRECLAQITRDRRGPVPTDQSVLTELAACSESPEDVVLGKAARAEVRHAVDCLPSNRRHLILALYKDEASYDEISSTFGMAIGSIGPTRARCMTSMRATLESAGMSAAS